MDSKSCPYELDDVVLKWCTVYRFIFYSTASNPEALIETSELPMFPGREAIYQLGHNELPSAKFRGVSVLNKLYWTKPFRECKIGMRQPFSWAALLNRHLLPRTGLGSRPRWNKKRTLSSPEKASGLSDTTTPPEWRWAHRSFRWLSPSYPFFTHAYGMVAVACAGLYVGCGHTCVHVYKCACLVARRFTRAWLRRWNCCVVKTERNVHRQALTASLPWFPAIFFLSLFTRYCSLIRQNVKGVSGKI